MNANQRSIERSYAFDTCVFSLGQVSSSVTSRQGERGAGVATLPVRSVKPRLLIERIARYCQARSRYTFRLIIDDATAYADWQPYFDELLRAIEEQAALGLAIRPILRSEGPVTYQRALLSRLGQLRGSLCFEIPEQLPQHGPEFAPHFIEAVRFAYEGAVGLAPLSVHAQASPGLAPSVFLRGLQRLHCTSLDVLWPRHFTPNFPPWSGRFSTRREDYLSSPVYGQWFSDLFKLWWILDDPSLSIEGFRRLVGRFDETSARQLTEAQSSFALTRDGELALPQRLGSDCISGTVGVGHHIEEIDILALEGLSQSLGGELPRADELSVDRRYFSERVQAILAQDCFQEFFYVGQESGSHEMQGKS